MNRIIVGFMGTGKTSVSKVLGRMTGLPCYDVDNWIEKKAGKSIPAIFAEEGEAGFRKRESEALKALLAQDGCILSGGGGIALREENVAMMKERGIVFCLTASPETIYRRVGKDENRPNLDGYRSPKGIRELMERREEAYQRAADVRIDTDGKSVEEVAAEILRVSGKAGNHE